MLGHIGREGEREDVESVRAAFDILAAYVPDRRVEAREKLWAAWASGFIRLGLEPPAWIDEVR
jgi:hypothetical protein